MLYVIYRIALVLIVASVLVVLIAPDIDLPDSTALRADHGVHTLMSSFIFVVTLLLLVLITFSLEQRRKINTRFNSPTHSSLCSFLC